MDAKTLGPRLMRRPSFALAGFAQHLHELAREIQEATQALPPHVVREAVRISVDAVEQLATAIATNTTSGPRRIAGFARAQRIFERGALALGVDPGLTHRWREAHVKRLRDLVREIDLSGG